MKIKQRKKNGEKRVDESIVTGRRQQRNGKYPVKELRSASYVSYMNITHVSFWIQIPHLRMTITKKWDLGGYLKDSKYEMKV